MNKMLLVLGFSFQLILSAQPVMTFDSTNYHFGSIAKGSSAIAVFYFRNTGDQTLVISNVNSSCGCLVPYYDKEPVRPGECGIISGHYDSNRIGVFDKTLTVTANTNPETIVLKLSGIVRNDTAILPTTVELSDTSFKLRDLSYDDQQYVSVKITNTGKNPLYYHITSIDGENEQFFTVMNRYDDKAVISLNPVDGPACGSAGELNHDTYTRMLRPGETAYLSFLVKNNAGNYGTYFRRFNFSSNVPGGKFSIAIKSRFVDNKKERTRQFIYNGKVIDEYHYTNGKLDKYTAYSQADGSVLYDVVVTDKEIIQTNRTYSPIFHERRYDVKTGKLISEKCCALDK